LDHHRSTSSAEAFPLAYKAAKKWREDAQWYGVIPFTSIERAFVIPLGNENPSWFFRFGISGSKTEYIVEVFNNNVMGVNETELPNYIEPSIKDLEPLGDSWIVIDNVEVLERYLLEKHSLLTQFPDLLVDYRLVQPKGKPHPIWILYNALNITEPIFVLDAITGEVIPEK
jgi:hypothetical protein